MATSLLAFTGAVLAVTPALAGETAIPVTPSGGTDVNQAILPAPGLYGAVITLPLNQNDKVYDYNGKAVPTSAAVRLSMPTVALGLQYVYPFKVFGGSMDSGLTQAFTSQSYKIGNTIHGNNTRNGDLYVDFFTWSRQVFKGPGASPNSGLNFAFGYSMKMPSGEYTTRNPVNLGNNVWVFIPNAAVTYTAPGIGAIHGTDSQISTKVFYGVPSENPATHYHTGNVMAVDFSVNEAFGPLRAGLAGTLLEQTTDDILPSGVQPPFGKKFTQFQVGPVVSYGIPNTKLALKFKYLNSIFVRNDINDQFFLMAVAMKFN
jgi:hypothetical protein